MKKRFVIILIAIGLIGLYILPKIQEDEAKNENKKKEDLNRLLACIENERTEVIRDAYELCGIDNEKGCTALSAINASFEGKYSDKKKECLDRFYNEQ